MVHFVKPSIASLIALAAWSSATAAPVNLLAIGNRLVTVDSATPGTVTSTLAITGLAGNETIANFDYRPASSRVLYGLSSTGTLYTINPRTGVAVAVGAPQPIFGFAEGISFNPTNDRLRVDTVTANNYRINPDTGVIAATDPQLAFAAGDPSGGVGPRVVAIAYTNKVAGATSTTLYAIDAARGVLTIQGSPGGTPNSPSAGQLTTVGSLGVPINTVAGFNIDANGNAFASLTAPGTELTSLYRINLTTGAATLIGPLGTSLLGLAFAPASISTYGTTANQIAVGGALDNFTGVPSANLNGVFNSLDALAPGDRGAALSQLTPAAYSLLPDVTLQTAKFETDTLQRYLRDFRDGATGGHVSENGKIGSFLIASGRTGNYNAGADRPRVGYNGAGVMGGLDYRYSDKILLGVTGGYDQVDARLGENVRTSDIRAYFGGAYTTIHLGPGYLDAYGTYGEANYDLRRAARFGTTSLDFTARTHSRTALGGGEFGIKLAVAGFVLEPFAGARYADVKIRGFSDGTDAGGVTLGKSDYESVLGNFGAKLGARVDLGDVVIRPEIRGAYRREFKHDTGNAFTYIAGGTGAATVVAFSPTPLARSYATAGGGFTVSGPHSPLAIVVDYEGEFARDRHINGITGGLRYAF